MSKNGRNRKRPGKRAGNRSNVTVEVMVRGEGGTYSAQTVDISRTGVLLWISDERFSPPNEKLKYVEFGERVAGDFQTGMTLHFPDSGISREADLVRVAHRSNADRGPFCIAAHFSRSLRPEECRQLGFDPDRGTLVVPSPVPQAVAVVKPEPAAVAVDLPEGVEKDRRRAPRVERVLYAEVQGDYGAYKAHLINLSVNGCLVTLNDPGFAMPSEPDKLVLFTRRLELQFGNGMIVRVIDPDIVIKGDVVRVSEKTVGGSVSVVIGCKFRRLLTAEECKRLEIEPPRLADLPPPENPYSGKTRIRTLMQHASQGGATDLHIKVGSPPRLRMGGKLVPLGADKITQQEAHAMALEVMTREQAARFEREGDVELASTIDGVGRFRINVLRQRGMTGLSVRCIPTETPSMDSLGLSPLNRVLAEQARGLVLVTGPTGSGKSTTLAAILNHINETRPCHVITMEDPIEYVHEDIEAHITQREIGRDAITYASALKRALRQDPDVIMIGEMRDLETTSLALTAAETGHLVFATLHTTSAALTPDRIVDVFPPAQQTQIRHQVADCLQGVMAQTLLPGTNGRMVLAQEILVCTDAVRALIRERKTAQIVNMMQTGAKEGMQTLEGALSQLVQKGVISYETAVAKANFPKLIRGAGVKTRTT